VLGRSKRPPEGSKSSANWLRSAGLSLSPARALDGRATSFASGGGLRRNAARALAIMPCRVPTSEVWTPPAPGAGIQGCPYCLPASVRLLIPLGAELVSSFHASGSALCPWLAFELVEQIALAELIAAGEGEDRADAHEEFFEGELRVGDQ